MTAKSLVLGAALLLSGCVPRAVSLPEPAHVVYSGTPYSWGHETSLSVNLNLPETLVGVPLEISPSLETEDLPVFSVELSLLNLLSKGLEHSDFDLPVTVNAPVVKWVDYFLGRGRNSFQVWMARSGRWRPMIEETLAAEGVPRDLSFLAMIESGFSSVAVSPASATGMWQLMHGTGSGYLEISSYSDERRDPEKATRAAAKHLRYLYQKFGDWYLAIAAYNAGEGTVARAIERRGTRDYWELCARGEFWAETRDYVPKLLAAMVLGKQPENFGLDVNFERPDVYDVVDVRGGTSLEAVAVAAGVELATVQALNPELKKPYTPPGVDLYPVKVPLGAAEGFEERLSSVVVDVENSSTLHRVARGESPSTIAHRYGITVQQLLAANSISDPRRIQIGAELVIPTQPTLRVNLKPATQAAVPEDKVVDLPANDPAPLRQDVNDQAGEKTASIITARPKEATRDVATRPTRSPPASTTTPRVHRVQDGDSLWRISNLYGVKVDDLKRANNLKSSSLHLGQTLNIPGGNDARVLVYTVRSGDNLWDIARQYGVDVSDLQSWNHLEGHALQVGDKLHVRLP